MTPCAIAAKITPRPAPSRSLRRCIPHPPMLERAFGSPVISIKLPPHPEEAAKPPSRRMAASALPALVLRDAILRIAPQDEGSENRRARSIDSIPPHHVLPQPVLALDLRNRQAADPRQRTAAVGDGDRDHDLVRARRIVDAHFHAVEMAAHESRVLVAEWNIERR